MNGMSWGSHKHSVPYTHKKPCTISMIIMDGEHYVTVDWITLKVCGWACVCALRFWQVTLGSSFTQFHEGIVCECPSTLLVNLGPLPSHGSCFEKHPSVAVMHKAPPTSRLFSPPSFFHWRNYADCLPPTGSDWMGRSHERPECLQPTSCSTHNNTAYVLQEFYIGIAWMFFVCLLLWSLSDEGENWRGEQATLQHGEDTMPNV